MTQPTFTQIATDKIAPSPYQYRKTFGGPEDEDLAESVKKHGVLQPIRVRPNGKPGTFELVFGERRLRAAKKAGLADVPAIVVDLNDDQVIEQLLIENLKRRDVHPLEEGEGFQHLLDKCGYTMEQLVAKTGKSKAHLYGRLKLTKLCAGAKKALLAGELTAMVAELVARIPDVKMQEEATNDVLGRAKNEWAAMDGTGVRYEQVPDDKGNAKAQPLSFRAAAQLIRRKYSTKLELAKFDTTDATLVAKAGACGPCPHRSGNQPELPGMAPAKGEDLCTNPSCFETKTKAQFDRTAVDAKKKGIRVIEGAAAKKIIPHSCGSLAYDANYVDAKDELPYNLAKPGSRATYGSLLGKSLAEIPKVLVQDPSTGAARELLVKDKAIAALAKLGKIDKAGKKSSSSSAPSKKEREARKKEKEDLAFRAAAFTRFLDQAVAGAAKLADSKETAMWRWVARSLASALNYGPDTIVADRHDFKRPEHLSELVDQLRTLADVRSFAVECVLAQVSEELIDGYDGKEAKACRIEAEVLFGADWADAMKAAKEAAKAEAASDAAKKSKKGATDDGKRCGAYDGKSGNACILDLEHDGAHSNGKRTWPDKKSKKAGGK